MFVSPPDLEIEGLQGLSRPSHRRTRMRIPPTLAGLRERVAATPAKLALISALLLVGAVCFGVIAALAERSRADAAQAVRTQTEPLLVQAVTLYTALSDANATVTTTFRTGGLEPRALRARYVRDLRLASDSLATLTREVGGSTAAHSAVRTITEQLPAYSGLIEAARANNRQGLPVGAAYLRQAAALLTTRMLPEANRVYAIEAKRLADNYSTGTAADTLALLAAVIATALALLALAQIYLARISRRVFNVPLLIASVVLLAGSAWTVVALVGEQNSLAGAQSRGSDPVEVLSAARVLVSRAQGDQSLILVSRGSDELDPVDLKRVLPVLAPPHGLIGEGQLLLRRTGQVAAARRLGGDYSAFSSAVSSPVSASAQAAGLTQDLSEQIAAAEARFMKSASDATTALDGLSIAIPVLAVVIAALALAGLAERLREYR